MLYLVAYVGGTYGHALCHFINQHIGFYSTTITSYHEENEVSGAFYLDSQLDIWLCNSINIKLNELKKYKLALNIKLNETNDHINFPNIEHYVEQNIIKPIIIVPNPQLLKNVQNRNIHAPRKVTINDKQVQDIVKLKNKLSAKFKVEKDFFCIDMIDLFNWYESTDTYPENYIKFCKFLDTDLRPTFRQDINHIVKRTKYIG